MDRIEVLISEVYKENLILFLARALRYCNCTYKAQDIVHTAFVKIVERIRRGDLVVQEVYSLRSILLHQIDWCAIDQFRAESKKGTVLSSYDKGDAARAYLDQRSAKEYSLAESEIQGNRLVWTIAKKAELSPLETSILLRLLEGKATGKVAEELGLSLIQMANAKYRLMQKLRKSI